MLPLHVFADTDTITYSNPSGDYRGSCTLVYDSINGYEHPNQVRASVTRISTDISLQSMSLRINISGAYETNPYDPGAGRGVDLTHAVTITFSSITSGTTYTYNVNRPSNYWYAINTGALSYEKVDQTVTYGRHGTIYSYTREDVINRGTDSF